MPCETRQGTVLFEDRLEASKAEKVKGTFLQRYKKTEGKNWEISESEIDKR